SMIVLIVVVGEGHCGTDQGPAARPGFRQNGQTFPEKARPETARRSPKPLGFPRSCWSLPATDSFCDPADLSAGLSAPQHGVGGVGRIPPAPAFGDAGGDVHQLVEVVDIGAVVDGPAPVPAGPAVHIAAPGDGLHQSALLAETQGGGDIGLAAGAVAVQLNEDIGHLMGVAEHGAVLLAHPVDKAPAAAAVHRAVIGAAVGVPDAVAELVVDAVHGPAVAVDLLADRLAVGEGLVAVVHGGSSGCKRSLQSHTRGRAVGCTMPPRWVLMMAPGAMRKGGMAARNSRSATRISRLARCTPRQKWGPWPKVRICVGRRSRITSLGLSYSSGSRQARMVEVSTLSPGLMVTPLRVRSFTQVRKVLVAA